MRCSEKVYFNRPNSIGSLLGFSKRELEANHLHSSDLPVNINKVDVIRIESNITTGAYINGKLVHTLHEFYPMVEPGYKIVEVPKNIIYLPVNVKKLTSLTIKITDQNGNLIDFRGENIIVRLHLCHDNVQQQQQ